MVPRDIHHKPVLGPWEQLVGTLTTLTGGGRCPLSDLLPLLVLTISEPFNPVISGFTGQASTGARDKIPKSWQYAGVELKTLAYD